MPTLWITSYEDPLDKFNKGVFGYKGYGFSRGSVNVTFTVRIFITVVMKTVFNDDPMTCNHSLMAGYLDWIKKWSKFKGFLETVVTSLASDFYTTVIYLYHSASMLTLMFI